jgi:colicin import membrane protein
MPPNSPKSLTRGRWRAVALSLLVHACIVAAAVLGWFTWKREPPPVTLAIEATIIDERALRGIEKAPEAPPEKPSEPEPAPEPPAPEPTPPPEEQGPPKPDPAELERKREEERLAAEKQEQEKLAEQKREAEQREQERLDAQKDAAARAAAEKAAAEKLAAEKRAAEKKRVEDAAAAKKAAEEKIRLAREAELRRSIEAEEQARAARNSDEAQRWYAQIVARIERAWIKPPSAQAGIECIVSVTQVPGGEVTSVRVDSCTGGGSAMSQSVEAAVYRASPLPSPPNPAMFERTLILTFKPTS